MILILEELYNWRILITTELDCSCSLQSLIQEKLDEEEAYRARTAVAAANREQRKGQPGSKHQNQTGNHVDNTGKAI